MCTDPSPAEQAMSDILANLEKWFDGTQAQEVALAAICQISGKYKMESPDAPR
jgi:hypothetical protein